jgi:hypothetical protein
MKALCWNGKNDIRCETVPDPKIEDTRDVIIKVSCCAICGSDLHPMDGLMPTMKSGDILGHEFMGEVIETGSAGHKLKKGDRIVVPFNINCGECRQCKMGNYSVCQRSNRNEAMAAEQFGYTTAGLFGYSHTARHATGPLWAVRLNCCSARRKDGADDIIPGHELGRQKLDGRSRLLAIENADTDLHGAARHEERVLRGRRLY